MGAVSLKMRNNEQQWMDFYFGISDQCLVIVFNDQIVKGG